MIPGLLLCAARAVTSPLTNLDHWAKVQIHLMNWNSTSSPLWFRAHWERTCVCFLCRDQAKVRGQVDHHHHPIKHSIAGDPSSPSGPMHNRGSNGWESVSPPASFCCPQTDETNRNMSTGWPLTCQPVRTLLKSVGCLREDKMSGVEAFKNCASRQEWIRQPPDKGSILIYILY